MLCIICGNKKFIIVRKKLRYAIKRDVLECVRCGFVFLRPKNSSVSFYKKADYRKKYGPKYSKHSTPKERFDIYSPFQKDIVSEIQPILRPNMKVLDVGCSAGHFLAALKGKVKTRVGIELNQEEAAFIRKNLDFPVYSEPIENLDIKEGPFDLVTSFQVLEHTDDPLSFLKNLGKQIKKGGYLYLELPNLHDPLLWYYRSSGYADFYYREPHLSYFSENTLRKLLAKAGFRGKIKTVQRYNFFNHLHWIFTNQPQEDFVVGNSEPVLVRAKNGRVRQSAKNDLNAFIKRVDREYKKIIVKHGLGESLTFLGQKR